jgi:hypothetical protein
VLIAVALFAAVDAVVLWSERPSTSERAWRRYWEAQRMAPPVPQPAQLVVDEQRPALDLAPRAFADQREGVLDRWLRDTLGPAWPRTLLGDLVGEVEIDLGGLSPEARTGALLLGSLLSPRSGVSVVQDGERLRITLSGASEDA